MGKLNMKLMQGVEDAEKQIQKEKQSQEIQDDLHMPQNSNNTSKRKKAENKPNTKPQKQVFSFRTVIADIAVWKAYATASGKTMENIGTAAMNEYMKRHKLTGAEQAVFEALMEREGSRE